MPKLWQNPHGCSTKVHEEHGMQLRVLIYGSSARGGGIMPVVEPKEPEVIPGPGDDPTKPSIDPDTQRTKRTTTPFRPTWLPVPGNPEKN